jgi:hypothetical protein
MVSRIKALKQHALISSHGRCGLKPTVLFKKMAAIALAPCCNNPNEETYHGTPFETPVIPLKA